MHEPDAQMHERDSKQVPAKLSEPSDMRASVRLNQFDWSNSVVKRVLAAESQPTGSSLTAPRPGCARL